MPRYVLLTEERTIGELVRLGAYFSVIRYIRGGIEWEVCIPNDEFEYMEENDVDDED